MIKEVVHGHPSFLRSNVWYLSWESPYIFENHDRFAKKFSIDMKELEIEEEQTVTTLNCGNG